MQRILLLAGTPVFLGAIAWGVATTSASPGLDGGDTLAALASGAGRSFAPVAPGETPRARLPAGVTIDPNTLELVGLELKGEKGSRALDWGTLKAYEYHEGLEGLPESIRALEGRKVTMAGFLLPLYEFDDIKEFNLVASHWSCCFGVPPGISGWVHVKLAPGQPGLRNTTEPLKITGTFHVAEQKESGYVVSIYAIEDAHATVISW